MLDPSTTVTCDADLEAAVGSRPGAAMLKSIRYLDDHCARFLAHSPAAALATTRGDGMLTVLAAHGAPGHLAPRSEVQLALGDLTGADLETGSPAALLALVPGYGETLRVNGRIEDADAGPVLGVEEALLHCAKAVMRSDLWRAEPAGREDDPASSVEGVLSAATFAVIASIDAAGRMDVSPRGDPPGLIHQVGSGTIAIAERPGNRRTDTLHNLVEDPRIAVLALERGGPHLVEVRGTAQVRTDPTLLATLRLRDRTPKAAIVIDVEQVELRSDRTLATALWGPGALVADGTLPRAAAIWADHVRRNTDPGTGAKVARRLVSETALAAGVALDYRANL